MNKLTNEQLVKMKKWKRIDIFIIRVILIWFLFSIIIIFCLPVSYERFGEVCKFVFFANCILLTMEIMHHNFFRCPCCGAYQKLGQLNCIHPYFVNSFPKFPLRCRKCDVLFQYESEVLESDF
ncbi:MAG: hypothetical protein KAI71_00855 [Candidatus Pacebacteria bacterium]|nr:hypothetical protein [Candidatus Paceibacterota bacterium]